LTSLGHNYIHIYSDGACSGNQLKENKGGWAAVMISNNKKKEISGCECNTTNQRMELTAAIKALETVKANNFEVRLYTDSAYITNCFNEKWYMKWKKNGWLNSNRQPVKNRDLWERLIELVDKFNVKILKVKGHSGDEYNERADKLAKDVLMNGC